MENNNVNLNNNKMKGGVSRQIKNALPKKKCSKKCMPLLPFHPKL